MSLTLYFYKVKKGTRPNCSGKVWHAERRMYRTYESLCDNERLTDKNGWSIIRLSPDNVSDIRKIYENYKNDSLSWAYTSYDDECEKCGVTWLCKRKFDFDKYDYYVLNA